eukprot:11133584-Lingulodinium_polyedra.AAC.1
MLVTQVNGARGDQCGVLQARSRRLWRCADCDATACPGCRRARPGQSGELSRGAGVALCPG